MDEVCALHQALQFLWPDRLIPVTERSFWLVVNIDKQSISARSNCGVSHWRDQITSASCVAGINNHR